MQIKSLVLGPYEENCYLYWDDHSKQGVVFDPGDDFRSIQQAIKNADFNPVAILLTHGHVDHIGAVREMKAEYDIPIYIGTGEEHLLTDPEANLSSFAGLAVTAPPADLLLQDEELLEFPFASFMILSTPGHSPASICYLDSKEGRLFCGDALFNGSIGRTDFPGGSLDLLLKGIDEKIMTLPDEISCFPGHGPATTVGYERRTNPFLMGRYHV